MTPKSVSQNKSSSSWLNTAYICWIIYLSLITLVLRCQFPAHSSGTVDSSRHLPPSGWHCTITFFPTIKTLSKMGLVLILGKKQLLTIFPSEKYELSQHFPSSLMIWLLQKKKNSSPECLLHSRHCVKVHLYQDTCFFPQEVKSSRRERHGNKFIQYNITQAKFKVMKKCRKESNEFSPGVQRRFHRRDDLWARF